MIGCGNCHQKHESVAAVKACHQEACYWGTCNHKVCVTTAYEAHAAEMAAEAAAERYYEEGNAAQQLRRIFEEGRDANQF